MRTIWNLACKDLLILWRDRVSMFWVFGLPLIFAAFFGSIFGGEGPGKSNPLQIAVVADDLTDSGRKLVDRIDASDAIAVELMPRNAARDAVRRGRKLAYLEVLRSPTEDLGMFAGEAPEVSIGIDPSRVAEKGMLQGLVTEAMFAGFRDLLTNPEETRAQLERMAAKITEAEGMPALQKMTLEAFFASLGTLLDTPGLAGQNAGTLEPRLEVVPVVRRRTGPPNAYSVSFPQSILWGIIGCAAGFALTLVRERTTGTMIRLLTAPISHGQLLAGKVLACALTCCMVVVVMISVGTLFFGVTIDSLPLLALATVAAAVCFSGITMLLGSLARTEQGVGGLAWGVLLIFAMLGGGMVPQITMPKAMLDAGAVSPARWTIQALEGAIWRDFPLAEMVLPVGILLAIGIGTMWLGAVRLRQTN